MNRLWTASQVVNLRNGGSGSWYQIENKGPEALTQVSIYDAIGEYGVTARDFLNELSGVDGPVELHLNTEGGEVFDGIAIYSALKKRGGVTVIVDSLAASIGSVIAMAGEQIIMSRNATMMIHDASTGVMGTGDEMRKMADLLDQTSDNIASIYADRAGSSVADWRVAMRATTWYTAEDAVRAGLADMVENTGMLPITMQLVNGPAAVHHTATENSPWDGPAAEAAYPDDPATLRYCYAWVDSAADPENKSSYKFPHHRTKGGPANLPACRNGLARLSNSSIPEGDMAGVKAHLQAHLDDAKPSDRFDFSVVADQLRRSFTEGNQE